MIIYTWIKTTTNLVSRPIPFLALRAAGKKEEGVSKTSLIKKSCKQTFKRITSQYVSLRLCTCNPLVTHDPNMLKKVTGELIWEN